MKILVVDSNVEAAQLVCQILREAGNDSSSAASRSQCFDVLSAGQYDLLLVDCDLSDCSIPTLMEEFKRKGISVPVVVFIAPGDEASALEAMEHGVYDYMIRDANGHYLILLALVVEEAYQRHLITGENVKYKNELLELNQRLSELAVYDSGAI